jgi:hypothetical protein
MRQKLKPILQPTVAVAVVGAVLAFARPAPAIVVLLKGSNQPVMGHVVRQDERTIVVREELADGKTRERALLRGDIDEVIETVSAERLAALDPAEPRRYREYAEELSEKDRDPEARDMAIRLYAIAAARGEGALRHGALLGLISRARTPAEGRRFRAAAWLYDPEHDIGVLSTPAPVGPPKARTTKDDGTDLLNVLRLLRQGKAPAARLLLERPAVQAAAASIAAIMTAEQLSDACAAKELSDGQLARIVRAELALLDGASAAHGPVDRSPAAPRWSASRKEGGLAPLPTLDLAQLTEFDPEACVFRRGKWVRP